MCQPQLAESTVHLFESSDRGNGEKKDTHRYDDASGSGSYSWMVYESNIANCICPGCIISHRFQSAEQAARIILVLAKQTVMNCK